MLSNSTRAKTIEGINSQITLQTMFDFSTKKLQCFKKMWFCVSLKIGFTRFSCPAPFKKFLHKFILKLSANICEANSSETTHTEGDDDESDQSNIIHF